MQFGFIFNICVCFECISDKKKLCNINGSKFVFLTEWFSATSSRDVTAMSMRFLQVGASESVTF